MANTLNTGGSPRLRAALARLDALVDWERRDRAGGAGRLMRVSVEPARDLVARLGDPERGFASLHVAGTKGKGSVAALVAAGLGRAGLRVGVYASPHVERIQERVVVGGREIADEPLAGALESALAAREAALGAGTPGARATWFDVLTAAALVALREAAVELAVLECGLGGRLDSTNVLPPGGCVITNVDLEHTSVLGGTRAAIAAEKAGILKPGGWVVSGVGPPGDEAADVVARAARERGVELRSVAVAPELPIDERNALLAGAALDELGRRGLAGRGVAAGPVGAGLLDAEARRAARLPGRLERRAVGGVPVVLDGAHVPGSLAAVLRDLGSDAALAAPPVVVLGTGREKDARGLLKVLLGRVDRVLCTSVGPGPYRSPGELLAEAREVGLEAEPVALHAAWKRAVQAAGPGGWVLVTGSLHLVGALRPHIREGPCSRSSPTCS